jgi:hypothetical protein
MKPVTYDRMMLTEAKLFKVCSFMKNVKRS